jgi:putative membrane-bound dehydrogenase-like protein
MVTIAILSGLFHVLTAAGDDQKPEPALTQPEPVPLHAAVSKMRLPEGFKIMLFAGEPDVRQPIAMTFDERGRLWIAECYSYPNWKPTGNDRILILEDTNHDGRFDRRKVFYDQVNYLTGLEVGFGGVWVCSAPHLYFLPDRNSDDQPDGPPELLLDGWSTQGVHNVLNGLTWGPDGWLYGCNGITSPSLVGKPGAADNQRQQLNCGIWRYHPTRHVFEVVCHGTTNPWGLDFDDHGQALFTNCVIGHLWHMIPGAHYQRMFGQDYNPYVYGLLAACSDHIHWGGGEWQSSRGGKGIHDQPGGGHAHCGCMIYLADNWPAEFRGSVLMGNIHGNRVNRDLLARRGSGYIGRHAPDFLLAHDEWFRPLQLKYGPDGAVYLIDWSDTGECHEKDAHGSHHESGRIYKIFYGDLRPLPEFDLAVKSGRELIELQLHRNDYYARTARRVLQDRRAMNNDTPGIHRRAQQMFAEQQDVTRKLRAMWVLYVTEGADAAFLLDQLEHENEHVRSWAVRLLCDSGPPPAEAVASFARMAKEDPSPLVRLYLASVLQRLPADQRWETIEGLISRAEDAADPNLPLMYWYAIEPLVAADKTRAIGLAGKSQIPLVRQYIARRAVDQ